MTLPSGTKRNRLQQAEFVISKLKSLGIRVNPASRLHRQLDLLKNISSMPGQIMAPEHTDFHKTLEALHDMQHLEFALDNIPSEGVDQNTRAVLQRVVEDPPLPEESEKTPHGRNFQFELYVYALLHAAGFTEVEWHEPPDIFFKSQMDLAIAVKRITSHERFEQRLAEASQQIERSGRYGIIAMNVTFALNPQNDRAVSGGSESKDAAHFMNEINNLVRTLPNGAIERLGSRKVLGIVLHRDIVIYEPNNDWKLLGLQERVPCKAGMFYPFEGIVEKYLKPLNSRRLR